ncbi:MAG TPA: hypothetical protein VFI87_13390, partial [Hyphomicrobiaceae bacterium]|nr:hypothetical protein [Hyphomicrobiaceae bacterium]
ERRICFQLNLKDSRRDWLSPAPAGDAVEPGNHDRVMMVRRKAARKKPLVLSAVSGLGMREALFALAREIGRADDKEQAAHDGNEPRQAWRP